MIQKTLSGNPSSAMPQGNGVRACVNACICTDLQGLNLHTHHNYCRQRWKTAGVSFQNSRNLRLLMSCM